MFSNDDIQLCISDELFEEYHEVLDRKRFSKYQDFIANAQVLLLDVLKIAVKYQPETKLEIISDTDDNKLLELAEASDADFIITSNTKDFTMKNYGRTHIVTPREFWEMYIEK